MSMDAVESPVPVLGLVSRPAVNRLLKLNGVGAVRPPFSSVATAMYPKELVLPVHFHKIERCRCRRCEEMHPVQLLHWPFG